MRGADIALIVYDVTSKETAETVSYWLEELRQSGEELGLARSFFLKKKKQTNSSLIFS